MESRVVEVSTSSYWRFHSLSLGSSKLSRIIDSFGKKISFLDAMGPYWLAANITLSCADEALSEGVLGDGASESARMFFSRSEGSFALGPGKYFLILPAFELMQGELINCKLEAEITVLLESAFPCPSDALQVYQGQSLSLEEGGSALPNLFTSKTPEKGLAARCKRSIDGTWSEHISLNALAEKLKVRPETFSRVFKNEYKISPRDYRTRIRVACAAQSLLQNGRIIDVAADVGFEDLSQFYRSFKNTTTVSPGTYLGSKNSKTVFATEA